MIFRNWICSEAAGFESSCRGIRIGRPSSRGRVLYVNPGSAGPRRFNFRLPQRNFRSMVHRFGRVVELGPDFQCGDILFSDLPC
jgi:hypothetical protein